jgi:16S rRNA (cytosine967-C5)-methyltransferase
VPVSAAVDETVKLAKQLGAAPVAGFVNAVLRGIARDRQVPFPDPKADPAGHAAARYSHPDWLVKRWIGRWGIEETIRVCEADNQPAPLTVRANRTRLTRDELKKSLLAEGIPSEYCAVAPEGLRLLTAESEWNGSLGNLESHRRGDFYVQDEAAQLVGLLLDPRPGERVLDVCAAPGGKTTHLAELMRNRGEIIALDIDESRLRLLSQNLKRLGHTAVRVRKRDAAADLTGLAAGSFDRILVDAPCSGLGLLRRNPEGKWKKTEALIGRYESVQRRILEQAAPLLKPGGILVYSTCTTEPEENENTVGAFRSAHPRFKIQSPGEVLPEAASGLITPEGFLDTRPNPFRMDLFFAARMVREG